MIIQKLKQNKKKKGVTKVHVYTVISSRQLGSALLMRDARKGGINGCFSRLKRERELGVRTLSAASLEFSPSFPSQQLMAIII